MSSSSKAEVRGIKQHYRSGVDDLSADFFVPCLKYASVYKRASGFFSSSVFLEWLAVLNRFVDPGNIKIQLIVAPELSKQDKEALKTATISDSRERLRQQMADQFILDILHDIELPIDAQKGNVSAKILAWMVANERLILRFAFPSHVESPGIFHEKIGVFDFPWGDQIAFTGSANETGPGYAKNYETIDVYRNWDANDVGRIEVKNQQFEEAWNNEAEGLLVHPLSEEIIKKVKERAPSSRPTLEGDKASELQSEYFSSTWRHQDDAVQEFLVKERGILEMATGTGKTRTALKIILELEKRDLIDSVIIAADGTDLLHQWADELYDLSTTQDINWRIFRHYEQFKESERFEIFQKQSFLLTSRYALPSSLAKLTKKVANRTLLIHDEVHKVGSKGNQENLSGLGDSLRFKLGLSATPEREYDEAGSRFVEEHIGPIIFQFSLEDAIRGGILAPFNYHPITYEPSSEDGERIRQVHAKYAKKKKEGELFRKEEMWNDIAKVYKTSKAKLPLFVDFIKEHQELLKRCIIFLETRDYGEKVFQIVHKYRSDFHTYYAAEESQVLKEFARGDLECLITCHRLSEGIDIQSLNTVILFSSARTRLETIQRIGRCLRSDPSDSNKVANVIDFIRESAVDAEHSTGDEDRREWLAGLSEIRP